MDYYIEITKLNSRREFYELAKKLEERGYVDNVEHCGADWANSQVFRDGRLMKEYTFDDVRNNARI